MSTFTITPDFGAQLSEKPRVLEARFGDGYSQRVGDGINTTLQEWRLTFSSRTASEVASLLSFFRTAGGVTSFDWTSPDGTVGKFICPEWSYVPNNAAVSTVSATFRQVPA